MIVLDASILIAHLDRRDAHHSRAVLLLKGAGAEPLGASQVTLAETMVSPARAGRLDEAKAVLSRLGVEELGLGDEGAGTLAELRAETGLKLPDCCVLLAAVEHRAAVASFDDALIKAARGLSLRVVN